MMKDPDGMILGEIYNIYHVNNKTGQITLAEEKIKLVDYHIERLRKVWHFEYTLKRDIKRNGCGAFGIILEEMSDQHVVQLAKMERRRYL